MMRQTLDDDLPLEKASEFFENSASISNEDLRQYIVRAIWEIDGFRNYFMELMGAFDSSQSEEEMIERFGLKTDSRRRLTHPPQRKTLATQGVLASTLTPRSKIVCKTILLILAFATSTITIFLSIGTGLPHHIAVAILFSIFAFAAIFFIAWFNIWAACPNCNYSVFLRKNKSDGSAKTTEHSTLIPARTCSSCGFDLTAASDGKDQTEREALNEKVDEKQL